ncbi:MAG: bifunctional hydroxymethylpyrimidine kinase/phosphomethylpyrimidine kinase [Ahniella sp.]|nr:bifunctional hydroxymethylpyrimidine kinase/phosphomethylpyrimidine kinase [Ahniella sp.]
MLRKHNKPCCLAISGLDPSGGAGLLADIRSFAAFGVHGLGLVSAETAQNSTRVEAVWPRPLRAFTQQLACLLEEFRPAATKVGLAGGVGQLRLIRTWAQQGRLGQLVVDPVLVASRGQSLAGQHMPRHLLELMPAISVLTPNLPELADLTGMAVDTPARADGRTTPA